MSHVLVADGAPALATGLQPGGPGADGPNIMSDDSPQPHDRPAALAVPAPVEACSSRVVYASQVVRPPAAGARPGDTARRR